jgi:hypothetical protein
MFLSDVNTLGMCVVAWAVDRTMSLVLWGREARCEVSGDSLASTYKTQKRDCRGSAGSFYSGRGLVEQALHKARAL